MKKNLFNENAVSEIVAMLLILTMAIAATAGLYVSILSDEGPGEETFVKIKGFVEGTDIVLEHQGGEAISGDSWISIKLPDSTPSGPVSSFLIDLNNDGKWNIGEKLKQHFEYNLSKLDEYTVADVLATDQTSNSIELMGPIDFKPVSDAGLTMSVRDVNGAPIKVNDLIQITITATSYGGDVEGSGGVLVSYHIPEGLIYHNSSSPSGHGTYDNTTGLWDVGNVYVGSPATIVINATVIGIEKREFVQLAMILDGSGSIEPGDWTLMTEGLYDSIMDEDIFPHDGSVELTVVQFGVNLRECFIEVPPTIVTATNYNSIATYIRNMDQGDGGTPMAAGIYLAADTLRNSPNFDISKKQIITLVTDGKPTYYTPSDAENLYIGYGNTGGSTSTTDLQTTETARNYSINHLLLNDETDEFNSLAVGSGLDITWLNGSIVWPEPGIIWDITNTESPGGPGWVATIDSFQDFELATRQMFKVLFSGITNSANFVSSVTYDPNNDNNEAELVITPE
jgi:hypothetical protein